MLTILNDAYSLHLIILHRIAGGVLSFLCHLGGGLFGRISVCLHCLLQRLMCVGEGTQYQVEGKKNPLFVRGAKRTKAETRS